MSYDIILGDTIEALMKHHFLFKKIIIFIRF